MSRVNQKGEEVFEETLFEWSDLCSSEIKEIVFLMSEHLGISFIRTNATKHGDTQIKLIKNTMGV